MNNKNYYTQTRVRTRRFTYEGSQFWLFFWTILFFPIALLLLLLNGTLGGFKYEGSPFWLFFWVIVFFPVALVLLLLNGTFLVVDAISSDDLNS